MQLEQLQGFMQIAGHAIVLCKTRRDQVFLESSLQVLSSSKQAPKKIASPSRQNIHTVVVLPGEKKFCHGPGNPQPADPIVYSAFEAKSTIHELGESASRFKESRLCTSSNEICKSRNLQQVGSQSGESVSQPEEVIFASHMTCLLRRRPGDRPRWTTSWRRAVVSRNTTQTPQRVTRVVMESMIGCHVVSTLLLLPVRGRA